jgi:putative membrane protein
MDKLFIDLKVGLVLSTVVYAILGMILFGIAFAIFNKLMPFSVRKEIEEDQNTSLGIIIGSFLIGLALIISSAMH